MPKPERLGLSCAGRVPVRAFVRAVIDAMRHGIPASDVAAATGRTVAEVDAIAKSPLIRAFAERTDPR